MERLGQSLTAAVLLVVTIAYFRRAGACYHGYSFFQPSFMHLLPLKQKPMNVPAYAIICCLISQFSNCLALINFLRGVETWCKIATVTSSGDISIAIFPC